MKQVSRRRGRTPGGSCLLLTVQPPGGCSGLPPYPAPAWLFRSCSFDLHGREVTHVATEKQYLDAAKKPPSARTPAEQALVERGRNMQSVRNADFKAKREDRKG